jgi:Ca2+-binding RTX toxin-like protein
MKHLVTASPIRCAKYFALLMAALFVAVFARAEISEPDTMIYGQIINRTSGQTDLIQAGTLTWTITSPDGKQITLQTGVHPYNLGQYCYELQVPNEALNYGLTVSSNAIPLTGQSAVCSHVQMSVDGVPARIIAPGTSTFNVAQNIRGSTYRLDLELGNTLASTSGDGIPDWWKAKYGIVDPNADPDGDGWSNLQEFLHGTNPNQDNRIPSLKTTELFVYADGTTGIRLEAVDSDSPTSSLIYTLTCVPDSGVLRLQGTNLVTGGSFTQDDVNLGRLVFVHQATNDPATATSFTVALQDENPTHLVTNNVVALNVYRPGYSGPLLDTLRQNASVRNCSAIAGLAFDEQQMALNYYMSRDQGFVIWDCSRAATPQQVTVNSGNSVLVGGTASDRLVGGPQNDVIIGGKGGDSLRGNGGSDLFLVSGPDAGNKTIEDFNTNENDVVDISRALTGTSTALTNYVRITPSGTNTLIGICPDGSGANFSNLVVTLSGVQFSQADLRTLVDNGSFVTGDKAMSSQVSVIATVPAASENGPVPGVFTVSRSGGLGSALTVNLQISGSAANGSDYQSISSQVTFVQGQRTAAVTVTPYTTSTLLTNVVQLAIVAGTGYDIGTPSSALVTIEPLMPQISITAIEPIAVKADGTAGTFLVSRAGSFNPSVLVRLTITGTAVNGVDYNSVSTFVNLAPQQTTALITITPKAGAVLTNGNKYVQIAVKPDATYKIGIPPLDRVFIVDQMLSLASWQQKYFPSSSVDPTTFGNQDNGNTGIRNILRYAFGLNAQNPNGNGRPVFQIVGGHLCVSYREPVSVTDINYSVEVSDDLVTWSGAGVEPVIIPAFTNDTEMVSWRSTNVISGNAAKQFMRVHVQQQ